LITWVPPAPVGPCSPSQDDNNPAETIDEVNSLKEHQTNGQPFDELWDVINSLQNQLKIILGQVDEQGEQGLPGEQGEQGLPGEQGEQGPTGAGGTQVIKFGDGLGLIFYTYPSTLFLTDKYDNADCLDVPTCRSNMIGVSGTMEKFVIDANEVLPESYINGVDTKLVITLQKNQQDTSISCTIMQLEPVICTSDVQISIQETDSLRIKFESQSIGNDLGIVNFYFKGFAVIRE